MEVEETDHLIGTLPDATAHDPSEARERLRRPVVGRRRSPAFGNRDLEGAVLVDQLDGVGPGAARPDVPGAIEGELRRAESRAAREACGVVQELPSTIDSRNTDLRPPGPIRVMICNECRKPQTDDEGRGENEPRPRSAHVAYPLGRTAGVIIDAPVENPAAPRVPVQAVLLDAYGTLLAMPDPVPRLRDLLADAGHAHPAARVSAALRAEIAFYRANHDRGRDAASLAALREECARVLCVELAGDAPPPPRLAGLLIEALRFELFPDVLPALDALAACGVAIAVVSNWDCSLGDVLRELGVADRFATVSVSAVVGARKPDPAVFRHALALLGVAPSAAIHCGDRPDLDCVGANRAGVAGLLIDREGALSEAPCPRLARLTELPRWLNR